NESPTSRQSGSHPINEWRPETDQRLHHRRSVVSPITLRPLARRLLIVTAVFLAGAAPARADLVRLDPSGSALAARAGGDSLAPEPGIWRLPAASVPAPRPRGGARPR